MKTKELIEFIRYEIDKLPLDFNGQACRSTPLDDTDYRGYFMAVIKRLEELEELKVRLKEI